MMTAYNRTYFYDYAEPYMLVNSTANMSVPDLPHPVGPHTGRPVRGWGPLALWRMLWLGLDTS